MFELDDPRRDELIESWAQRAVARGLGTAAIFLLEAHKPLGSVGAHALLAFGPLIGAVLPWNPTEVAAFVRHVDNLERLIRRIEELENERAKAQAAARRRRREVRRRAQRIAVLRRRGRTVSAESS